MNLRLPHSELTEHIRMSGLQALEGRQLAQRLRKFLPQRLSQIKLSLRESFPPAKANRHALTDPRYLAYIEEYITIRADALETKIQYETHLMLLQSRKSRSKQMRRPY